MGGLILLFGIMQAEFNLILIGLNLKARPTFIFPVILNVLAFNK
jgi:hypothetical protein